MIVIKRAQHLWIAAAITSAILIGTTGVLVKRQFAQEKGGQVRPVQEQVASSTANHQPNRSDRIDSDGLEFERRLVKLAPFSATLVNENTQGSAPATVATSLIFRDAKGRTRRDRMQLQSNPSSPNADQQPQISTINDPVAGFTYALEHGTRLFRRSVFRPTPEDSDDPKTTKRLGVQDSEKAPSSQMLPMPSAWGSGQSLKSGVASSFSKTKTEKLGEREIEGVMAEGTRVTVSVPAGAMENSEPMEIVVERWYSPELKTAILVKRSDPRHGESIYRLTNLKRDEPAATLFVVPKDYKLSDQAAKQLFPRN